MDSIKPINSSPLEQFSILSKSKQLDLAKLALLFAMCEYPDLNIDEELQSLDSLASVAKTRINQDSDPISQINALSEYLFDEVGFQGNYEDYYDPRNSFLNEVLNRRQGIPITLSLLYIEVGKRLGILLEGVGMPGHFLVRMKNDHAGLYIDPFHRGILLSQEECAKMLEAIAGQSIIWDQNYLTPVNNIELISRLIRNVHAIYTHRNETTRILTIEKYLLAAQFSMQEQIKSE